MIALCGSDCIDSEGVSVYHSGVELAGVGVSGDVDELIGTGMYPVGVLIGTGRLDSGWEVEAPSELDGVDGAIGVEVVKGARATVELVDVEQLDEDANAF